MAKDVDYRRIIHTKRWLRLRKAVLTERPLCERCRERGELTAATEVHHRVPVETALRRCEKEELMFNPGNLMAVCRRCHAEIHTEMGRCGRERMRMVNAERTASIIRRFFGE